MKSPSPETVREFFLLRARAFAGGAAAKQALIAFAHRHEMDAGSGTLLDPPEQRTERPVEGEPMQFDVKVGVNKDGYEVYRVEAESIAEVVKKAHAEEKSLSDDDTFRRVGEADMACLTRNWGDVTAADVRPVVTDPAHRVTVRYTNYRGETADRVIVPEPSTLRFGSTEHHREPQWLIDAWDVEKNAVRTFALKDVHFWRPC